jgi:hypothetical protein
MPTVPNAVDFMDPRLWTGIVQDLPIPEDYLGLDLLPMRDVPGDRLQWDIFKNENPIAPFVALDAESPRMDDEIITSAFADIAYIRFKRVLYEHDLRILREFGQGPVRSVDQPGAMEMMANAARNKILRQGERLSRSVDARIEWLCINSLLGSVSVSANSYSQVQMGYTYPVMTVTPGYGTWDDTTNSDPLRDMNDWFTDLLFDVGTMVAGRKVFSYLMRNANMRRQLFVGAGITAATLPSIVTRNVVEGFLRQELGIQARFYDARYTTRTDSGTGVTVTMSKFLPDNKVIFLPTERVGYTASAPAPQNNYKTGKFAWTVDPSAPGARKDPWVHELGVGFYGLPVLELPQRVMVATVA